MNVTTTGLTQAAGVAAAAAGTLFIGIQIGHPHLDATSIQTTEMAVRDTLKVLMAALALAGITGMYLSQVRRNGVLGLVGYLVLTVGYLLVMGTAFAAAFVIAAEDQTFYKNDGVDFKGVMRAAWNNFTGGELQGASTIPQQYARTAADLHLGPGEFAVHQGAEPALFAVLSGKIEVIKSIAGIERRLDQP